MAKPTRASARKSKTRKLPSAKVGKSNAERTKKAVEARRCKFSPELEARARFLFEETDASMGDMRSSSVFTNAPFPMSPGAEIGNATCRHLATFRR